MHQAAHVPLTLVALARVFISLLHCPLPQLCFDFRLHPSRSLPSRSASASTHLSLSLSGGRGTEEAGCCRPVPIGGRWPWPAGGRSLPRPAQAATRLDGGRSTISPVSAGELQLLVPLLLSRSLLWNLLRACFLPPALPLTSVESKASCLLWRRVCSALALKRRLENIALR